MFNPRVKSNIEKAIESFKKKSGNEIFSDQLFLNFYEHLRKEYDAYDEIADLADLKQAGTPNSYVQREGVSYFKKTEYGFIDITYI
jgi:hypothetical protein